VIPLASTVFRDGFIKLSEVSWWKCVNCRSDYVQKLLAKLQHRRGKKRWRFPYTPCKHIGRTSIFPLILNLGFRCRWVNRDLVPLWIIGWKDRRDLLDVLERIKYSCSYWDSNPETFNSKCSHYIDYATLSPKYKTDLRKVPVFASIEGLIPLWKKNRWHYFSAYSS
jgi:hypothetical protein